MENDYDTIIKRIEATIAEKYEPHDSMRWPYMAGALQAELRAMCELTKIQEEHIREIKLITQFLGKH
jgi:hypothetical protein